LIRPTDPGRYRTKLVYQEKQETGRGRSGQVLADWVDRFPVWASLRPLSGRETLYARSVGAETTHEVRARFRPGIAPAGRFVVARTGAVLRIESVRDLDSLGVELVASVVQPS